MNTHKSKEELLKLLAEQRTWVFANGLQHGLATTLRDALDGVSHTFVNTGISGCIRTLPSDDSDDEIIIGIEQIYDLCKHIGLEVPALQRVQ